MKLSTLLAATVIASAGFGGAAFAQQTSVSPTNQAVPGSVSQENNAEALERAAVAASPGAPGDATDRRPGCSNPIGSNDSGLQACEEAERAAVAAGTSAQRGSANPGVDASTTSSTGGYNQNPVSLDVPGSSTLENRAEELERQQVAE
ncbi:hypothetical protein [Antarcticirhabdus aurantiaca]|uniref:Uncharacterized protein n=1 Tax=Antarcticirhabdus aurantiaca TaxID=2606717 RepID=A0ACD4NN97_9HYPH|nr:hypothetical protein [Antarcticirhabdus aurantiaca]WAJ28156.1 hypothetical protein OXU80_25590 [Jeongeuplla avenae]